MQEYTYKEILQNDLLLKSTNNTLFDGEIHIWIVSLLPNEELLSFCRQVLSDDEKKKATYLKFEKAQNSYIISQGVLRSLLSSYLNISAESVDIGRHKKGKPYSMNDPSLFFNISNSGEYCVFAFTKNGEIGIDLEEIRTLPDLDELIQANFYETENDYIKNDEGDQVSRFFKLWTLKESYQKAIGEGMRLSPENIEFAIEGEKIKLISVRGLYESGDWNFSDMSIIKDYATAITYKGNNPRLSVMQIII